MDKEKSVFQYSAENGISFGLYLSVIFFTIIYGGNSSLLSFIGLILIFAIPVVLFRYMGKYHIAHIDKSNFSSLWTLGTLTFLCGALICSIVSYIWLEYVIPGFIYEQAESTLAVYEQIPEFKDNELTKALRIAIENNDLPSPIQLVIQMLWFSFSAGVIVSLLLAPLAKLKRPKHK